MSDMERRLANVESRFSKLEESRMGQHSEKFTRSFPDFKPNSYNDRFAQLETRIEMSGGDSIYDQLADDVTGIIGLREIVVTKQPSLKLVWLLLFCGGIGATMYFTYATTMEYIAEPTVTKVKLHRQETYEYPPIVLCLESWFDVAKALNAGLSMDALKYSLSYWDYPNLRLTHNASRARHEFFAHYRNRSFVSLADFYKSISIDMRPTFDLSEFVRSEVSSYLSSDDVPPPKKIILPGLAICHQFSLKPVLGRSDILSIPRRFFFKHVDKTERLIPSSTNFIVSFSTDADALYGWPASLRASKRQVMTIRTQRFIALPSAQAPCVEENSANVQSGAACLTECAAHIQREYFGCELIYNTNENLQKPPQSYCNHFDERSLVSQNETQFNFQWSQIAEMIKERCEEPCPHRCERIMYEASIDGEDPIWNDRGLAATVAAENYTMRANESITFVEILHDSLRRDGILTFVELSSYSFTELVTNVGGTLGLFLGATVGTLMQMVMFGIKYWMERPVAGNVKK